MTTKREPFAMTFEETVLTKLTAIETNLDGLPARVATLETHRNFLAGAVATVTAVASWLHWRPL